METLKDLLWPVVLLGGFGALIDFLIGRTGQEKARDWLLRWWVIFDDVRWRNFGREEGLFAGRFIEKRFGKTIWSRQRIKVFFILTIASLSLSYLIAACLSPFASHLSCLYCNLPIYHGAIAILLYFVAFTTSISFTKFITFRMAYLCGNSGIRNLIVFIMMLIINFFLFIYWAPVSDVIRLDFLAVKTGMFEKWEGWPPITPDDIQKFSRGEEINPLTAEESLKLVQEEVKRNSKWGKLMYSTDNIGLSVVEYFPSLLRFILSFVFVGSFLLRPVLIRPISLVWARIVESDKPVFTVIFGGAAAFASAIGEAAKHL